MYLLYLVFNLFFSAIIFASTAFTMEEIENNQQKSSLIPIKIMYDNGTHNIIRTDYVKPKFFKESPSGYLKSTYDFKLKSGDTNPITISDITPAQWQMVKEYFEIQKKNKKLPYVEQIHNEYEWLKKINTDYAICDYLQIPLASEWEKSFCPKLIALYPDLVNNFVQENYQNAVISQDGNCMAVLHEKVNKQIELTIMHGENGDISYETIYYGYEPYLSTISNNGRYICILSKSCWHAPNNACYHAREICYPTLYVYDNKTKKYAATFEWDHLNETLDYFTFKDDSFIILSRNKDEKYIKTDFPLIESADRKLNREFINDYRNQLNSPEYSAFAKKTTSELTKNLHAQFAETLLKRDAASIILSKALLINRIENNKTNLCPKHNQKDLDTLQNFSENAQEKLKKKLKDADCKQCVDKEKLNLWVMKPQKQFATAPVSGHMAKYF